MQQTKADLYRMTTKGQATAMLSGWYAVYIPPFSPHQQSWRGPRSQNARRMGHPLCCGLFERK